MKTWLALTSAVVLAACGGESSNNVAGDQSNIVSGEASYVIPLIDEKGELLSRFNEQAVAKGLKPLPDSVEVRTTADMDKVFELRAYFDDEVAPAVNAPEQAMPGWGPDSFTSAKGAEGLCFKGNPLAVADLIDASSDRVFSEMLMVHGWRYKSQKWVSDGWSEFEGEFPAEWKSWKTTDDAVLVVTTQSDGGDDPVATAIPPCR